MSSRTERERELNEMATSEDGYATLVALYNQALGLMHSAVFQNPGASISQMIENILEREFSPVEQSRVADDSDIKSS